MHYEDSLAVECTSVVNSFLRCIVDCGLNECTLEHPLCFQTPLKMAVPSNSALFEGLGAISDTANEIIKGANEEGNEGRQVGEINQ